MHCGGYLSDLRPPYCTCGPDRQKKRSRVSFKVTGLSFLTWEW